MKTTRYTSEGNGDHKFRVNPQTGVLYLDYEMERIYNFTASAVRLFCPAQLSS